KPYLRTETPNHPQNSHQVSLTLRPTTTSATNTSTERDAAIIIICPEKLMYRSALVKMPTTNVVTPIRITRDTLHASFSRRKITRYSCVISFCTFPVIIPLFIFVEPTRLKTVSVYPE